MGESENKSVRPIRPTKVIFDSDKEMDEFLNQIEGPKKKNNKINEMMKKHMEQRKK